MHELEHLSPKQKLLGGLAILVVLYALYVRHRSAAASAALAGQAPAGGGAITPAADAAGMQADYTSLFSGMKADSAAANAALQGLISTSAGDTVKAINDQTAGIIDGLKTSNTNNTQAIGSLQTAQTGAFSAFTAAISKVLSDALGSFTAQMDQSAKLIGESNAAMATLTASADGNRQLEYLTLGSQSGASCFGPGSNDVYRACLDQKVAFDGLGQWAAGNHDEGKNAIQQAYADCKSSSGYDLICVGKKIAARGGIH